ncbi:hypothetical protein DH2020_027275 [Rehmannia glutinosa]|uniref:BZIP domain-containing protein n=1 Tax=Rehmannia glutinosa TaxID=99300 RepID=A0ABR0VXH6_REHGL
MGSNLNFKNFGNDPPADGSGGGGRPPGSFSLTRQSSVYSLTFDEFQSTVGIGKDFGSMNMDELLKSIWSAEDNQNVGSTSGGGGGGGGGQQGVGGSLQKQGSLILPRTLSQKKVDEVWRDMSKENGGVEKDATGNISGFGAGGLGMVGLGGNGVGVGTGSPAVSSDGLSKSNGDTSRRSAALEKVVERRQRRMIKNRESAARSRARKQAYTMELEAEVAKLKEENEELQKKQAEMMEMQKNQVLEMINQQNGAKRQCLRRTQTGPW